MSLELLATNWNEPSPGLMSGRPVQGALSADSRGLIRLDADLRIVDACVTARRLLGRRRDELVGERLVDLIEDGASNFEHLCRQLPGAEISAGVVEVRPLARVAALPRSQLTVGWLPGSRIDRSRPAGAGSYVVVISPIDRDQGPARGAPEELSIVEGTLDLKLRYRLWPERGFDLVDSSSHELLGYPPAAFYAHPDLLADLAVDKDEFSAFMRRCEGVSVQPLTPVLHLRHRDGRIRAFEMHTTSIRNPERGLMAIEAVGREVTDRDEDEQELRAIVAFRRGMHESAGRDLDQAEPTEVLRAALAAVCDHTGWNIGHAFLVGSEPRTLASAEVWHLGDPDRFEAFRELTDTRRWSAHADLAGDAVMMAIPTVAMLGQGATNERTRLALASGLKMAVVVPVTIDAGVGAALEFLSDDDTLPNPGVVRALGDAAAEVSRAMRRSDSVLTLRRMDEARTEFVARAAHELRGPVGSVALMASALALQAKKSSSPDLASSLERLAAQADRIQSMATRLLELSQLESGRLQIDLESVPVRSATEAAVQAMLPESGPPVQVVADDELRVLADPLLLDEILANLLANARRYGGPSIRVEAANRGQLVELAVSDDGPGIPVELEEQLFEPMRQQLASPSHSGLGLALVRQMAGALGGDVNYERTADARTRFVVTLQRG